MLAKRPVHPPHLRRLECHLREQAHSHKGSVCLAKAARQKDGLCSIMTTPEMYQLPLILWERACSRRGRYIRHISGGWNAIFVSKLTPTRAAFPCESSASERWALLNHDHTRDVSVAANPVGASLLAKRPRHPLHLWRLKCRLCEQAHPHYLHVPLHLRSWQNPELLFPSIANIVTNAVLLARANPDDGGTD